MTKFRELLEDYWENHIDNQTKATELTKFITLPLSMQWGVLKIFFDTHGIDMRVVQNYKSETYYSIVSYDNDGSSAQEIIHRDLSSIKEAMRASVSSAEDVLNSKFFWDIGNIEKLEGSFNRYIPKELVDKVNECIVAINNMKNE